MSEAPPEDSDERHFIMRRGPNVVILSEEDVVAVLHTAETTNIHVAHSHVYSIHLIPKNIYRDMRSHLAESVDVCIFPEISLRGLYFPVLFFFFLLPKFCELKVKHSMNIHQ